MTGEKIETKAVELIDQIQAGIMEYAPKVGELGLKSIQIDAIIGLVINGLLLLAIVWGWCKFLPWASKNAKEVFDGYETDVFAKFTGGIIVLGAASIIIGIGNDVFQRRQWVAAIAPEAYVALEVFDRVTNGSNCGK